MTDHCFRGVSLGEGEDEFCSKIMEAEILVMLLEQFR